MLIELVRSAATTSPDSIMAIAPTRSTTYSECLARAESLARGLAEASAKRFACVVRDVGELVALLAASSAAGVEVCVYPNDADEALVADYAASFDHDLVVTDRELASEAVTVAQIDTFATETGPVPRSADRSPVLILTTGTTGRMKAVRHDWCRLVEAAMRTRKDPDPGARWLLVYNLNQFAGLQVLLHVLATAGTLVDPPSRRPQEVLDTIRDARVSHISGTPTFWRLLAGYLDESVAAELPLKQITLGGEAVPGPLLQRLATLFPAARVSQIYGATEFGTGVSVRDLRSGLPLDLLDRDSDADVQLRIVDGQLETRSKIGMLGYYGEDDVSAGWRPTGDLVEIRDSRIHFIGRLSEIINVGGVKVHPLPVEELVHSIDGIDMALAYGRPNPVTGQIVAIDVVARRGADTKNLEAQVRSICQQLPAAARPRLVRFVDQLEQRGQKTVRSANPDPR